MENIKLSAEELLGYIENEEVMVIPSDREFLPEDMFDEKLRQHQEDKYAMIELTKQYAAELSFVCHKYNNMINEGYHIIITSQDFKNKLPINKIYNLVLLDQYYPEKGKETVEIL